MNPKRTPHLLLLLVLAVWLGSVIPAKAQQDSEQTKPFRQYTNPDAVITLSKDMTFAQAVDVLNTFAQRFENRFIYDHSGAKGSIGVSLPPMDWHDALNYLVRLKGLSLEEHKSYYEITQPQQAQVAQQTTGKDDGPNVNLKTREVRISATFFEGNRETLREIGVDWSTLSNGKVDVNFSGAKQVTQDMFSSEVKLNKVGGSQISVNTLLNTFEANNLGEILAQPNIKVMNGMEGRIQVGQDFSIKQKDFAGNVTDKFFSVGTILKVVPHIIQEHDSTFIYMEINAERSTAQPDPVSTIVNKQQATSDIMLVNGESTVIAGLYNRETNSVRKGIPFLKDLPPWFFGLRYLFGYESHDVKIRELVIIIKAEIDKSIPERMREETKSTHDVLQDHLKILNKKEQKLNW